MKTGSSAMLLIAAVIFTTLSGCQESNKPEAESKETEEKENLYPTTPPKRKPYPEPLPDSIRKRKLTGSFRTPEEACDYFLEAVAARDSAKLIQMSINQFEYLNWCWVEFGASDPKYNVPTSFAWENHYFNSMKGLNRVLSKYGGKKLAFVSLGLTAEADNYQTFRLFPKPTLTVADTTGKEMIIKDIDHIIEMNGYYKVFNYKEH